MSILDRIRHPAWTVALILIAFVVVAMIGGTVAWFAQGALAKAGPGLIAVAFYLALIRLTRFLRVTTDPEESDALYSSHALARPMLRAANYLGAAIVVHAIFG